MFFEFLLFKDKICMEIQRPRICARSTVHVLLETWMKLEEDLLVDHGSCLGWNVDGKRSQCLEVPGLSEVWSGAVYRVKVVSQIIGNPARESSDIIEALPCRGEQIRMRVEMASESCVFPGAV